ncbi:hypothetical protein Aspvir_006976 [Aspergillus viridinutans]|uniref:Thioesterase domain-containing protein n=1 Tax=Aspergillus viridinutans TaxID=75553 RepID=A0A9P3C033_ASPVI|nr:uncharacterized protein Aspvir_006976 [Aspergillus viridinutans]GIK02911.1 hypothetical protein Aspvir_006976 [Aspergillus viridinutans]
MCLAKSPGLRKALNVEVLERWKSGVESIGYAYLWWDDVLLRNRDTLEPFCHTSSPGAPMWPKFALTPPTMNGITVKRLAVAQSVNFFSAQPCTRPYLHDISAYQPIPFFSRYDKGDTSDTFFNETLRTARTIPHALAVARKEVLNLRDKAADEWLTGSAGQPDYVLLVQFASGLNGYRDTVHSGVLASLLDEALGCCVEGFRQQLKAGERTALYTANLNVSYRAPVASPGVYVIKAWLARRDGRKWFLEAQVVGGGWKSSGGREVALD